MKSILISVFFCIFISFFAGAENQAKVVELILDASGSMNANLPEGMTRIEAARQAVSKFVGSLPSETQLSFRVYGHQSPREKHDCNDTQLMIPFGNIEAVRSNVVAAAKQVKAQGYTPITKVITLAASDFPASMMGQRTIVLVSDGKETCEGDPCAAARALRNANVELVIHTIGFGVDDATRFQLKCIAGATGGSYYDAENADQLTKAMGIAAAKGIKKIEQKKKGGGFLQIKKADVTGHDVTDAESGKNVGAISSVNATLNLPAGIYNVTFGKSVWKSVEVKNGETTVLEPGVLEINHGSLAGNQVVDSETGLVHGEISSIKRSITLMPGLYDVTFGKAVWPVVKVNSGKTTTLNAGILRVTGASFSGNRVRTADGKEVGDLSSIQSWISLPPGSYTIEVGKDKKSFTIAEGQELTMDMKE
jgi:uncharacterized protein YerC